MSAEPLIWPEQPPSPQRSDNPLMDYQRVVLFYNPISRHAANLEADVEQLRHARFGRPLEVIVRETSSEVENDKDLLLETNEPGDINVWRFGDGTGNRMNTAAKAIGSETPILMYPRGNANDGAGQLLGRRHIKDPTAILRQHSIRDLHSLEAIFSRSDSGEVLSSNDAWLYMTIGKSALAGVKYNEPAYRNSLWHKLPGGTSVRETATAFHAFFAGHPFMVKDSGAAESRVLAERIIAPGGLMAKYFKLNADLFSTEVRLIDMSNRRQALPILAKMLTGIQTGSLFDGAQGFKFEVSNLRRARVQIDGDEVILPPPNADTEIVTVEVRRSEQSIRVFSLTA